jgi:hypothetical protein
MLRFAKIVTSAIASGILSAASVGCSAMKGGSLANVEPITQNERVGSVYLLRGWIGIFSTGIDSLGSQINEQGVHAEVFQETQWSALADAIIKKYENEPAHEPIVLIGHSYGADDVILITRRLAEKNIHVDLVVTLDPVTPKKVPANATLVYNLYQPSAMDSMPFLRGIPLTPDQPGPVELRNINVRVDRPELAEGGVDHFNIEKKPQIHQDVITRVLEVCAPRDEWVAAQSSRRDAIARSDTPEGLEITSARQTDAEAEQMTSIDVGGGR